MNASLSLKRFVCPHCKKKSRLPQPVPESGLFLITCAFCGGKTLIRFDNHEYCIEKPISRNVGSFSDEQQVDSKKRNPLGPRQFQTKGRTFFRSLRERVQQLNASNQRWDPPKRRVPPREKVFLRLGSIFWICLFLLTVMVVAFAYLGTGILQTKSELSAMLTDLSKSKPTKIIDRNGQVLSEIFQKRISTLKLSDYPEHMITALLNVEDKNFYSHGGVDLKALTRAAFTNLLHMKYKQGASTITQQLARIMLNDRKKSLARKWKELELALALETYLSKDEILEYYMNHVYLGHGAYGFGEAIKFYFHKNPSEITRTEAFLLASLASAPNRNSPLRNPETSRERLEAIFRSMKERGILTDIPRNEINEIYTGFATRSPNETVFGNRQETSPYITESVRIFLNHFTENINIYEQGGFLIETTIQKDIQKNLESLVSSYLQTIQKNGTVKKTYLRKNTPELPREVLALKSLISDSSLAIELSSGMDFSKIDSSVPDTLQSAIIGLNPNTGEILFLHGGDKFHSRNQYNRAIQMRRQTGSSIKPILYAAAINSGVLTTADRILDAPLIYRGVQGLPNWTPDNHSKSYEGEISLRYALVKSKNTAAVQVAEKLGTSNLDFYFSMFFFPDKIEKSRRFRNDLSLALGSLELSPLEMASAYSAFLNEGKIFRPYLIRRIIHPDGHIIYESGKQDEFQLGVPQERVVVSPDTAEVMLSLLKDSAKSSSVFRSGYRGSVAGKTGTTNDYRDAWFIGLKPGLSLAVWIGFDNPRYGMGPGGMGGRIAAPLWGEIAKLADRELSSPGKDFPKYSHAVPGKICPNLKSNCGDCPPGMEWFTRDNLKLDSCTFTEYERDSRKEVLQELF